MRQFKRAAVLAGLWALALGAASCSHSPKAQTPTIVSTVTPPAAVVPVPASLPVPAPDMVTDEHAILAAQRALTELGYNTGKADGMNGPATRHAIQAFQKDHGLAEDGRLTFALAKMLNNLLTQSPKSTSIVVAAGDSIIYSDGSVDSGAHERVVQWDQEGSRVIIAVRPSTRGWPSPARAGLDWAITHALDGGYGAPVQWSSTGVDSQFEIHIFAALSSREAAAAAPGSSCRRFELRETDSSRRYPGLACQDAKGEWYLPHTRIHLARPATTLGTSSLSGGFSR
jgi:peptidoglycan hydrolase-like protein with peptidoglycan-binding domain